MPDPAAAGVPAPRPFWHVEPPRVAALALGVLLVFQLAALPPWWLAWVLLAPLLIGAARWPRLALLAWALFGAAWTIQIASHALAERLPPGREGETVELQVEVEDLPARDPESIRFVARVIAGDAALQGRRLRIAWYGADLPALAPGERWTMQLRLRAPRGLQNPGGFDAERYALQMRIVAQGTVLASPAPQRVAQRWHIDGLRARLSALVAERGDAASARFLRGLAVGDTRALDERDWEILRQTGLSHLLAISGLHIALVAGFAALWLRGLYWMLPRLGLHWPLPQAAAAAALLGAVGYSALAGFGLPTQRSLVMLAVVLLALLLRQRTGLLQGLALAGLAVWLFDPLAPLSAGFWLSFLGVFWLLLCVPQEAGTRAALSGLVKAQWAMAIGLLPLSALFFGQASVVGALLNLVAVPWVTLIVVPLLLLGLLLAPLAGLSTLLLQLAGGAMTALWRVAESSASWPWAAVFLPEPGLPALLLALMGAGVLLLPRGLPGKPLAALLFLPLLWPARAPLPEGALQVDLLDVGQGLAVLLRTREHALLYDAGARGRGGHDLGEAVVLPALRALDLPRLDRLIVSHGDNDHAGGAEAVRRGMRVGEVLAGEPRRVPGARPCEAGTAWRWNGVEFALLHPPEHFPELGNDSSCVLRVAVQGRVLLLPGDIGEVVEQRLLREAPAALRADVLVLPHHGSRSSSSAAFVGAVRPALGLIAAGHRNRFGHPHPDVVARYVAAGTRLHGSAESGALRLRLAADTPLRVAAYRHTHRRFWHAPDAGGAADAGAPPNPG
jgi:competence protein ComEC